MTDNRRWICQEVVADMRRDTMAREGQPLTGPNLAVWLAEISASVAGLAKVVETLLPPDAAEVASAALTPDAPLPSDMGQDYDDRAAAERDTVDAALLDGVSDTDLFDPPDVDMSDGPYAVGDKVTVGGIEFTKIGEDPFGGAA